MVLCVFILITTMLPVSVYANNASPIDGGDINIMPHWSNINSIDTHLVIENGNACITITVVGHPGTESITVSASLDRVNANGTLTRIASWNNMRGTGIAWGWETTQDVGRGHDYRLTITVTVVRNGVSETVTVNRTARAN